MKIHEVRALIQLKPVELNRRRRHLAAAHTTEDFRLLAPPLGRRTVARLDHARPPARTRLRTARPALGIVDHLGRDHAHDQANHPPMPPQERSTGIPRIATGLIAVAVTTATRTP